MLANLDKKALFLFLIFSLIVLSTAIFTHGTCDEGDSVFHYLHAKYAFQHVYLFLNHWAKPLYVLLASPFAQAGFMGVKLWNTFLTLTACWFCYLIAKDLNLNFAWLVFPIALFFKLYMVVSLSGLTEPLFNFIFTVALFLVFRKNYFCSAILVSFLPFVRSEGLFVAGTFSLYLLWMKQWKTIPLLGIGHLVYGCIGWPVFHDFFWTFHKIPYTQADGHYGSGKWFYYIEKMPEMTGLINCYLLGASILIIGCKNVYFLLQKQTDKVETKIIFLAFIFWVFLGMHATFWALGIFGSAGLVRVFVAIASVFILLILYTLENAANLIQKKSPFLLYFLGFIWLAANSWFASNQAACSYNMQVDFGLRADQECDVEMAHFIKKNYPNFHDYQYFCEVSYVAEVLDLDIFDDTKFINNEPNQPHFIYPKKSFVIWDDWYSGCEHQIKLTDLQKNEQLQELKIFEKKDFWGYTRKTVLFIKKE